MTGTSAFDPAQLASLDRDVRRIIGKPIGDCTIDDLNRIIAVCEAETTRMRAEVDQAEMTAREAHECGCTIRVPLRQDGSHDLCCAFVNHTCGRTNS